MTPKALAKELGISPKTLRDWLRWRYPREPEEKHMRWVITPSMAHAARVRFEK